MEARMRRESRQQACTIARLAAWLVIAAVLLGPEAANAQTADTMSEPFTIQLVDLDPGDVRVVQVRRNQGAITAFAAGATCATVDASEASPPALLIGLPGQPDACREEGRDVVLRNERGMQLVETFVIESGERAELSDYAPVPPVTGLETRTSAMSGSASDNHQRSVPLMPIVVGLSLAAFTLLFAPRSVPRLQRHD